MVQLCPSIFVGIFSLYSLGAVALPSPFAVHPRTVGGLTNGLTLLQQQLKGMTDDLNAFPTTGGTIPQALAIHNDATRINGTLRTSAQEAVGTIVSSKDAIVILNGLRTLGQLVPPALRALVEKKSAFDSFPFAVAADVVRQDILDLDISSQRFGKIIVAQLPKVNMPEASSIFNGVHADFAAAEAAFADV